MNDLEFVEELAKRLNLLLEADSDRLQLVLGVPLSHAGYASVGHFISQLGLPRGITQDTPAKAVENVKFLVPVIEKGRILKFEVLTGDELYESHMKKMMDGPKKDPGPGLH